MSIETFILVSNTSTESTDLSSFTFSNKRKGAGYHRSLNPLHTAFFDLDNFKGSLKIQATLEADPVDADWVDVVEVLSIDSTALTSTWPVNFNGNWVWVRAAYILEQGTINSIRYNF
jgi:hypothetical protein